MEKQMIVITTQEKLREVLIDLIWEIQNDLKLEEPDTLDLKGAVALFTKHGYPISKYTIDKHTSEGTIPYMKHGDKLLFSRRELLEWAGSKTRFIPMGKVNSDLSDEETDQ